MSTAGAENAEKIADDAGCAGAGGVRHAGEPHDGGAHVGGGRGNAVAPIPASIVRAICMIMSTVEAVKKSQRNTHGGYNYASTDDIYAAVTRKMGEVGLVLISLEDKCEIKRVEKDGKVSQWAHLEFSFVLATAMDTWSDPRAKRTLYIQVTGPQTFQAAQSYAEKSYLRSLLKLPTGDMDLDSMPQADNEDDQIALSSNGRAKRKSSAEGKRDGSVKIFNAVRHAFETALNPEMLQHLRTAYAEEIAVMPSRWTDTLDEAYEARMNELRATLDAAE